MVAKKETSAFKIQYINKKDLKVNPDNPRFIRDHKYEKLKKAIQERPDLFDARPVICSNRTGKNIILAGNMRYRAAVDLKYDKIPAIIMPDLTIDDERQIAILDNVPFGEWDMDALANSWSDLPLNDWGLDIPEINIDNENKEDDTKKERVIEENVFSILVECDSEEEQKNMLERFSSEGIKCRALIL